MAKSNRRIAHVDLSRPEQVTRPKAGKKHKHKRKPKTRKQGKN